MALDEPKLAPEEQQHQTGGKAHAKRDDAPDYYKRPKFKRNIIPFDTEDLSVRVIRDRFLIPDQVKENSPAAKAGLKLGDQIVKINGADASAMRLSTAESVIKQAGEQLQLVVAKDDEETAKDPEKPKETREVTFAGNEDAAADVTNNTPAPKIKPDEGREGWIQPPERKVWHPIVWQQPPPPIPPDQKGITHQRLIANVRRLLTETANKPTERQKHVEHMFLALPTGSRPHDDDDEDEEPPKPAPVPKRKTRKVRKVVRKRTESETSEESHPITTPAAAEGILEEA